MNKNLGQAPKDLQEHIRRLEEKGLLTRINRSINKDTELHPLSRWQFQGGLHEDQRRGFLFTDVHDAEGGKYDIPVATCVLAGSSAIYAAGLGVSVEEIGELWVQAMEKPIDPVLVDDAPCQELVITDDDLTRPGGDLPHFLCQFQHLVSIVHLT